MLNLDQITVSNKSTFNLFLDEAHPLHSNRLSNANKRLCTNMGKDYYSILGITRNASDINVKKA